ncbi:MAG: hypothetical protein PF448_11945 [Bacteroidales bacterium]|jgi:hypothetical protein|nr:hypothetical protein [Bacteroidales bacterium]
MMDNKEIKALIRLLDDPDNAVYDNVSTRLVYAGEDALPLLEASLGLTDNSLLNSRLQAVIEEIQNLEFYKGFEAWLQKDEKALIYGLHFINQLYYPDTDFSSFKAKFDELRRAVWLEMNDNLTGFEAIKTLNYFIFEVHSIIIKTKMDNDISPHFIDALFVEKSASPFAFIGMYAVLAQSLDLPVYPVYLPGLLVMAYENAEIAREAYGKGAGDVLFYINPYDKGAFLGRKALEFVVEKKQIPAEEKHFKTLSNQAFIFYYLKYLKDTNVIGESHAAYSRLVKMLDLLKLRGVS